MGNFNFNTDLEDYNASMSGNASFFSLADDGDSAMVRVMYKNASDIEAKTVHEIKVVENGKEYTKTVNCLRDYGEPMDKCPLCEAHYKTKVKIVVPLYNIETNEVQFWSRGLGMNNSFYTQLVTLCNEHNPIVSYPVEIVRNGKKGDMKTTYDMIAEEYDGTELEDLPEIPSPIGTVILDKSYDELVTYLNTGSFATGDSNPMNSAPNTNTEVRRRRDVSVSNNITRRRSITNDTEECPL